MLRAYVDEAGTGGPPQERVLVVAALIIREGSQLQAVEARLRRAVVQWIPESQREGFVFHATDLFNSGKKFFRRNDPLWPLPRRLELAVIVEDLGGEVG